MGSVKSEGLDRKEFGLRLLGLRHMLLSSCVETCHFPMGHGCPLPAPPSPALMSNLTTHVTGIKGGHCSSLETTSCDNGGFTLLSSGEPPTPAPSLGTSAHSWSPARYHDEVPSKPCLTAVTGSPQRSRLEPQSSGLERDKAVGPAGRHVCTGL